MQLKISLRILPLFLPFSTCHGPLSTKTPLKAGSARHKQLSDWLRSRITSGAFVADQQLPSENQLCSRFGVSRITVRRALQTLEGEGLIYRQQGLGSFVAGRQVQQGLVRLTSFVEDMAAAGLTAASEVLHFGPEKPPAEVAAQLEVDPEVSVIRLDRLRLGNGTPIAFDRTWLPAFYAQLLESYDLEHETIYHILETHFQIPVVSGRYRIEAVNAPADVAAPLAVPEGRALLLIERTSLSHGQKRIYFQRRYYRSDRVAYQLALERIPHQTDTHRTGWPLQEFEPVFKAED